jgi:hypothetical protein
VRNLFSVELKNQPGEIAHLGDVCAQRGVNLQLAGVVSAERATILFSASDEAAVRTALAGAGLEFTERPAVQVKSADQPGEAAKFGRKLADAGVNIEGLLELTCQGEVIFASSRSPLTSPTMRGRHSATRLSARSRGLPAACALVAGMGGM